MLVDSLRQDWENLTQLADTTRQQLLHEHRHIHERETDKQVRIYTYHTCMCVVSIHVHGVFITPACTFKYLSWYIHWLLRDALLFLNLVLCCIVFVI